MRVDLSGGNARVTKQLLDDAKVSAVFEKVRGETVAQHVGCHVPFDPGPRDSVLDVAPHRHWRERSTAAIQENGSSRAGLNKLWTTRCKIPLQCLHSFAAQRDDPASTLSLYRSLIGLRHDDDAIGLGAQRSIDLPADTPALAYTRFGPRTALVAVNCGSGALELDLRTAARGALAIDGRLVLSTAAAREPGEAIRLDALRLAGNEAVVLDLG